MNKTAPVVLSPWDIQMLRARYQFLNQVAPEVLHLCDEVERLEKVIAELKEALRRLEQ